jgi:hypothetical protein
MAFSFCPRCGTPRLGAFRFCRQCELDFDALSFSPTAQPSPPAILAAPTAQPSPPAILAAPTAQPSPPAILAAPATESGPSEPVPTPDQSDHSGVFLWSLSGAGLAGIVWLWLNVGPYDLPGKVLIVAVWSALWIGIAAAFMKVVALLLGTAGRVVRPFRRPK